MNVTLKKRSLYQGFTLVEVLVVVSIIVVLMSLVMGGMQYFQTSNREKKAEAIVQRLGMHVQDFYTENGYYPKNDDPKVKVDLTSNALYMALFGDSENRGRPDADAKVYFNDLDPNLYAEATEKLVEKRSKIYVILDPWGKPYRYRLGFNEGGNGENPDYDIWSAGKDGKDGTADDICNFKKSTK